MSRRGGQGAPTAAEYRALLEARIAQAAAALRQCAAEAEMVRRRRVWLEARGYAARQALGALARGAAPGEIALLLARLDAEADAAGNAPRRQRGAA